MTSIQSRITAQGQTSVPAAIRRKLGLTPGTALEWIEENGAVMVRRAGGCNSLDIHRTIFPQPPQAQPLPALREGIRALLRRKHARP
jgi:AbrB family looped-hinge helix DNA binding protein